MDHITKYSRIVWILCFLLMTEGLLSGQHKQTAERENVLDAMRRASKFMANTVSNRGGYLWKYAEDFSEVEGEAPSRTSQIMVQSGTPGMGHLFLDMYETTGEEIYLDYAKNAANALILGQHPLGGWHYFIDFDMSGLDNWYKEVASRYVLGMEEYRHFYGNCTYDDNATQGATAYLLRIYMTTLLPEYLAPLRKALDFILLSQYPNGGWPQRYPLRYEFVHDGFADYTSMYTLNDNAMSGIIRVLLDAFEQLGDERYLEAARRGGDFFMVSQGPEGQAGWAEQYDMNLQPCWGRTHEPPSFMPRQTVNTLYSLAQLYLFTGDRRYLRPFPAALDWLFESGLRTTGNGSVEFARLYEPGTNLPIKVEVLEERNHEGYDLYKFTPVDRETYLGARAASADDPHAVVKQVQGRPVYFNMDKLIAWYERIKAASPKERQKLYQELFKPVKQKKAKPAYEEIEKLIGAMNEEGAWIEDIQIWDYQPDRMIEGKKTIRGISVGNYIKRMRRMMDYIAD